MKMRLDFDLLRTFVEIVAAGGFTRAGERLHLTQPTISLQVRRLEEMIGKRLFDRNSRKVMLTHDGEILLGYARRILQLSEEAHARITAPDVEGVVRIGIPEDFAHRYLPAILARFSRAHRKVQLQVRCDLSTCLLDGLAHNEYDLILVKQGSGSDSGILIWREPLVWAVSTEYDLEKQDTVPLILFPHGCLYRKLAIEKLEEQNREWWISYVSPSLAGLQAAVLAGLGVAILAESALPAGYRILGHKEGFPSLPNTELALHYGSTGLSYAAGMLAEYITDSLDGGTVEIERALMQ